MLSISRRGFTLIELLVVIAIITILIAISVIVGARVVSSGKGRITAENIRVLDSALQNYINRLGHGPEAVTRMENGSGNPEVFAIFDGMDMSENTMINSLGLFIEQAQDVSGVGDAIAQIDGKYAHNYDPDGSGPQPELMTVFDGWDRPIRYVHPTFDGIWTGSTTPPGTAVDLANRSASPIKDTDDRDNLVITQVRRNYISDDDREANPGLGVGDSDGGICPSPQPYFYSAGDDGDPSTLGDNIYTTAPRTEVTED